MSAAGRAFFPRQAFPFARLLLLALIIEMIVPSEVN